MEPIAIVGLSCRFPGAGDAETFWQLLRSGGDAVAEVPPDRWDVDELYDPAPARPGKMNTRRGGFLRGIELFDAHFFGITPEEAAYMDPQQRWLLEVAWEAVENAGYAPDSLAGSQTGVFIGISAADYNNYQLLIDDHTRAVSAYSGTGTTHSIAANRLSYVLDLRGPSLTVDTACSSSLVAVHLACQSLRHGECGMALVGGVNLILSPEISIGFSQARVLAPDGRCKTFDERADGYVRGEGCGVVVLRRLPDAVAAGDRILAVIRGSAVNQDGRSNGLTAPNGPAQRLVIRRALENAGVTPNQISYVEAHGTGTLLGDLIEIESLKDVFGQHPAREQPCVVGSVKPNIGHLEAAAGVASLIKVVLSLNHCEIPPQLHLRKLNPHISLKNTALLIPTERRAWPRAGSPRFAGVSSFGFGGTNAHVIVEEAPAPAPPAPGHAFHLLTLSALSENALKELARRYEQHLSTVARESLPDICFTANVGRTHFGTRLALVADSVEHLRARLEKVVAGADSAPRAHAHGRRGAKVAFLFTGQGAQYAGMGRALYDGQPTFRRAIEKCAELFAPYLGQPLVSMMYPPSGASLPLDDTVYAEPAEFALGYALTELWLSWGVRPDAVLGYGSGEYVAACTTGALSLEDGVKLVSTRARLLHVLPRNGLMAVVQADESRVAEALAPHGGKVSIAAINGAENIVISGVRETVLKVLEELKGARVAARLLPVPHALNSILMEPILDAFERRASVLSFRPPRISFVSSLSGRLLEPEAVPDAHYWRRHMREPLKFAGAVEILFERGCNLLLEIGPHPTLAGMVSESLPDGAVCCLPSLQQGQDDWQTLLSSLGALYTRGVDIAFSKVEPGERRRRVPLPTYPFERESYWIQARSETMTASE